MDPAAFAARSFARDRRRLCACERTRLLRCRHARGARARGEGSVDPRGHRRAASRLPAGPRRSRGDAARSTVSSEELAEAAGVNSAKVRKDLSHLGSYGTRGVGYDVAYLIHQIRRELGLTQHWSIVIAGIGNLGQALANYKGFAERGFRGGGAGRRRPGEGGGAGGRAGDRAHRRTRPASCASPRRRDRGDRDARRRRSRTSPTGSSTAGIRSILNFAPGDGHGAARGLGAQGRPGGGTADPRLLRAAEGDAGGGEAARPGGGRRRGR